MKHHEIDNLEDCDWLEFWDTFVFMDQIRNLSKWPEHSHKAQENIERYRQNIYENKNKNKKKEEFSWNKKKVWRIYKPRKKWTT